MKYPDYIYSKFKVIEKEICGEKHYGLVKIYNILGFNFSKHMRVMPGIMYSCYGRIDNSYGRRWLPNKITILDAISNDDWEKEYNFRKKVTK